MLALVTVGVVLRNLFDDPRILGYLEQVATIPVIKNAEVTLPEKGIARRSSLSVLFEAIYVSPLDQSSVSLEISDLVHLAKKDLGLFDVFRTVLQGI